jgi:4-amino-4-deoxychorismate lyase
MTKVTDSPLLLETISIESGEALHINYHNIRFKRTREELFGLGEDFDLAKIIEAPDENNYRCRILYDQTIHSIEYIPYQEKSIKKIKVVHSDIEYNYKYADRTKLNELLEENSQSDEVLIIKNGLVTDTTIANIAFLQRGVWITPKMPLLAGTTRQRLIDTGFLRPIEIKYREIPHFDGVALMNAMVGFKIITPTWVK